MKHIVKRARPLNASNAAALVAAVAKRLVMSKEDTLSIAKAEPKGATVFAGSIKRRHKPVQMRLIRTCSTTGEKRAKEPVAAG